MAAVDEAESALGNAATLFAGLRVLSVGEEVTFVQHVRKVLPIDGYVFWLATQPMKVFGSLHISADKQQREDETLAINRCVFTTEQEIQAFNEMGPNTLWIAEVAGVRFAFSQRGFFYRSARLFHYTGDAVYPAMESQIVPVGTLQARAPIVSNSLPAWLQIVDYNPVWLDPPNPRVMLYPSFLVPANLRPPYGAVHIDPAQTQALQAVPQLSRHSSDFQLAQDRVRVTLYGLDNDQASAWRDTVLQFSRDTNAIGMTGVVGPIRDEKRTQAELGVIAMKKTIEFDVSYIQKAIRDIARQLILSAPVTFITEDA